MDVHQQAAAVLRGSSLSSMDPQVALRGLQYAMDYLAQHPDDPAARAMVAWFMQPRVTERLRAPRKLHRAPPAGLEPIMMTDKSIEDMENMVKYMDSIPLVEAARATRLAALRPALDP